MDPIDYRTVTWKELQDRITGLRYRVYRAWQELGPGTTREIAARSGIDILTFRPRSTELYQLGFLILDDTEGGNEGRYRAATAHEAHENFLSRQDVLRNPQMEMPLA
jgi:hypothetical protein